MQINLIFTREILLLASFCKREFLELRNGLFDSSHYVKAYNISNQFLLILTKIACAADEIKLLLSLSGKQSQNPCYQSLAVN